MGEAPPNDLDRVIADYYDRAPEEARLAQGPFQLEEARTRDLLQDSRFALIVEQDLRDGQHRNPTERLDYFTTAYFHRPEELAAEVRAASLALDGVYGIEGPGWILPDVAERMADAHRRASLLQVARMVETEPSVLGSSAHLLAVAQRPD